MKTELIAWLGDLGRYLELGLNKGLKPRLGQGVDYTRPEYRSQVRTAIDRLHPRRMQLRVDEVIRETPSTRTLRCVRTDGPLPPFRAGQYVSLSVELAGVRVSRPYSISSPPGSPRLDLTVRDKPGGFVAPHLVGEIAVGATLESSGPAGSFYHEPLIDGTDLVFLAGGSGITPFMSIIREQATAGWPLRIQLLYGSRTPEDVIFAAELQRLAAATDRFTCQVVISEPPAGYEGLTGLLDADLLEGQLDRLEDRTFYLCGPGAMYDLCLAALEALGAPAHRIRRELYGPPDQVTDEPGWPESVRSDDVFQVTVETPRGVQALPARAGEPLMNSLERHGLQIPARCRSGECSLCRTKILSGTVFMPPHTGIRESDRAAGYVHACVAYPLSPLRIRIP